MILTEPSKRLVADILNNRGSFYVHLNPKTAGVDIPSNLRGQPQAVFHVGSNMQHPIVDFRIDDHGIFGTLRFGSQYYACTVPWASVFALVSGGDVTVGRIWWKETPDEIAEQLGATDMALPDSVKVPMESVRAPKDESTNVVRLSDFRQRKAARS